MAQRRYSHRRTGGKSNLPMLAGLAMGGLLLYEMTKPAAASTTTGNQGGGNSQGGGNQGGGNSQGGGQGGGNQGGGNSGSNDQGGTASQTSSPDSSTGNT